MKRIAAIFWSVPPWRALLEAWLVSAVLLFLLAPVVEPTGLVSEALALVVFVCGAWAGLRMRLFLGSRIRVIGRELLVSLALMFVLLALGLGIPYLLGHQDFVSHSAFGMVGFTGVLLLASPGFLAVRIVSWLWLRWDRLRRTRYLWALTHAHLTVVVLVALIVLFLGVLRSATMTNPTVEQIPPVFPNLVVRAMITVFPWVVVTTILILTGLAFVLPPSALFSYLVARRMTRRLEGLAKATHSLRGGDLSARVEINGEDEVAQLQSDFNAMAADLQHANAELQAERDKVQALLRAQQELTASVSHELRTPVATMRGYLDALQQHWQDGAPEARREDLEIVAHEVDRLQALIEDLFALSRAEIGQLSLRIEPVDVTALVQRVVATVAPLAWNSGRVEVLAELAETGLLAQADPGRLEQILSNLLHNGVRHTPPGGLVVVKAAPDGDEIRLDVADTGEGIAAEDLPRVWERFFQAGGQNHPNGSAGLGLALVKELAEAMGGRVGVESRVGEGTRFSVWVKTEVSSLTAPTFKS